MDETNRQQTSPGLALLVLGLLVALLIGGLYYFVYEPQRVALDAAQTAAAAAAAEAAAARRDASGEAAALRAQVSDLEALLAELQQTSAELEAQIRQREAELEAARSTQDELVSVLQMEISNGQIQVQRMRDSLRVDLVNEILFDSGEAELKPAGMDVLTRVGDVLKNVTDRQIIVQGHTDYVTIGGRLAQRYATNWELSSARAVNVVRFLQDSVGVDPTRLAATGFSEYRPRADNSTDEGRRLNRRIEILLAPLPQQAAEDPAAASD